MSWNRLPKLRMRKNAPCQALDMNGVRCRRTALRVVRYHGDSELYGAFQHRSEPQWVAVNLCDKHSSKPKQAGGDQ